MLFYAVPLQQTESVVSHCTFITERPGVVSCCTYCKGREGCGGRQKCCTDPMTDVTRTFN